MKNHKGRLSQVVDIGTRDGERKVMIAFQLADIDIEPKDKSLPIYKQFAKPPYGGFFIVGTDMFNLMCNDLGCYNNIQSLALCVGNEYSLDINIEDWKGKSMYTVVGVEKLDGSCGVEDWGVDTISFIFSGDTTLEDINSLGFEKKHVMNSNEYNAIMEKYRENESVIF